MEPIVAEIVRGFKDVHAKLREELRGMDRDEVNWAPAADANSAAVLVVHTIGSATEVMRIAANVPSPRDRDAEFRTADADAAGLIARLDAADAMLDDLGPRITAEDLAAPRPRRDNPPQPSLHWLVTNYGHAREHLAHIQLTRQLYAARQA